MATIERSARKTSESARAVIGVAGRSGSGKTTLLELLIPELTARGLAVGAVKHTSHGFLADRPGKDSHRLYESGAASVALISGQQLAAFTRLGGEASSDASIDTALAALPGDLDVVLVEGFSWEPIPRFVLVPDSEPPIPEHLSHGEVLRVLRVPATSERSRPSFPRELVESLASEIELRMREGSAGPTLEAGADEAENDLPSGSGEPIP